MLFKFKDITMMCSKANFARGNSVFLFQADITVQKYSILE